MTDKDKKWAVTLQTNDWEKLEPRVTQIVEYLAVKDRADKWNVSEIDATGKQGNNLTFYLNDRTAFFISTTELLNILQEDGQVIDMNVTLVKDNQELLKIIVRDGISIDILGFGEILPSSVLGKYVPVDVELFLWESPVAA